MRMENGTTGMSGDHLAEVHRAAPLQHGLDEVLISHGDAACGEATTAQGAVMLRRTVQGISADPSQERHTPVVRSTSTPELMAASNLASTCTSTVCQRFPYQDW